MLQVEPCQLPLPMEQRCAIQHRSPLAELALEKCGTAQKSSGSEPRRFGRRHEPTSKTNNQRLEEVQERVGSIMSMRSCCWRSMVPEGGSSLWCFAKSQTRPRYLARLTVGGMRRKAAVPSWYLRSLKQHKQLESIEDTD